MRFPFFIISLCIVQSVIGQHSLQLAFGVSENFRTVVVNQENLETSAILDTREKHESPKIHSRIGIDYFYNMGQRLVLKSGIRYAVTGYTSTDNTVNDGQIWASEQEGSVIPGPNTSESFPEVYEIYTNYTGIEVPIMARYLMSTGKLVPYIEAGINPHMLVESRNISTDNGQIATNLKSDKSMLSNIQFVSVAGVGLLYSISDRLFASISAVGRYHLNQNTTETNISENLYNYAGEIGFGIRL